MQLNGNNIVVEADELETVHELGRGAYGIVEKMRHRPSAVEMAVKVVLVSLKLKAKELWEKLHGQLYD